MTLQYETDNTDVCCFLQKFPPKNTEIPKFFQTDRLCCSNAFLFFRFVNVWIQKRQNNKYI